MSPVQRSSYSVGENSPRFRSILAASGVCLIGLLAVLSFLPLRDKLALHTKGRFHDGGHVLAFGVLALTLLQAARSARMRWLLLGGVLLFGWGIETAQHLAYGEPLERGDIWLDAAGAILGALLALAVRERAPRQFQL